MFGLKLEMLPHEAPTPTRTRHGYEHMDTYNVQNIKRSTGVVSVSDTDTDACRTPDTTKD